MLTWFFFIYLFWPLIELTWALKKIHFQFQKSNTPTSTNQKKSSPKKTSTNRASSSRNRTYPSWTHHQQPTPIAGAPNRPQPLTGNPNPLSTDRPNLHSAATRPSTTTPTTSRTTKIRFRHPSSTTLRERQATGIGLVNVLICCYIYLTAVYFFIVSV